MRLMTVHKAKGLEFPVVILADNTSKLAAAEASRHIDPERNLCAVRIAGWSPADLLQHEALELARDEAEGVRIAYVAATILGAPTEEVAAAATAVSRALGLSVLTRAHDADARGDLRRETPVAVTDSHGTVVNGVVDLAFREDDGWVVVDFKTDREISDRLADYQEQVRLYACAIARATGLPTSGILVRV